MTGLFQHDSSAPSNPCEPTPTPPGLIEAECRDDRDLMKKSKTLKGDLEKLCTLVSKNKQLSVALEQENALMRSDYLHTLKACLHIQSFIHFP